MNIDGYTKNSSLSLNGEDNFLIIIIFIISKFRGTIIIIFFFYYHIIKTFFIVTSRVKNEKKIIFKLESISFQKNNLNNISIKVDYGKIY